MSIKEIQQNQEERKEIEKMIKTDPVKASKCNKMRIRKYDNVLKEMYKKKAK